MNNIQKVLIIAATQQSTGEDNDAECELSS